MTRIGPFTVVREIARGGMGIVYVARQDGTDREVALKLMLGDEVTDLARQRFTTEARALARLNHPGIGRFYDMQDVGGQPSMIMEYIEGRTMRDYLNRQPLMHPRQAVELAIDTFGFDGPWWNYDVPARPDAALPETVYAVTGAARIDDPAPNIPFLVKPGPAVLHMEFTPRGEQVWMSVRDGDRVVVYDTGSFEPVADLPVSKPSGIFFTSRAGRIGL